MHCDGDVACSQHNPHDGYKWLYISYHVIILKYYFYIIIFIMLESLCYCVMHCAARMWRVCLWYVGNAQWMIACYWSCIMCQRCVLRLDACNAKFMWIMHVLFILVSRRFRCSPCEE